MTEIGGGERNLESKYSREIYCLDGITMKGKRIFSKIYH